MVSEKISLCAEAATSATARSKAASLAFEGLLKPLSLRTNCSAAARISSSVAGGSKLKSVRMLRHMQGSYSRKVWKPPKIMRLVSKGMFDMLALMRGSSITFAFTASRLCREG